MKRSTLGVLLLLICAFACFPAMAQTNVSVVSEADKATSAEMPTPTPTPAPPSSASDSSADTTKTTPASSTSIAPSQKTD
ncbi:MAG TPA: hypothetical protein VKB86_15025, partial [Pyrinomonadaceae bacterium]|nr:hypothetical protein [Pyrinomonadaceae bacterium]